MLLRTYSVQALEYAEKYQNTKQLFRYPKVFKYPKSSHKTSYTDVRPHNSSDTSIWAFSIWNYTSAPPRVRISWKTSRICRAMHSRSRNNAFSVSGVAHPSRELQYGDMHRKCGQLRHFQRPGLLLGRCPSVPSRSLTPIRRYKLRIGRRLCVRVFANR